MIKYDFIISDYHLNQRHLRSILHQYFIFFNFTGKF